MVKQEERLLDVERDLGFFLACANQIDAAELPRVEGVMYSSAEQVDDAVVLRLGFWGKSADEARALVEGALAGLPGGSGSCAITAEEVIERIGGNVIAWASGGRVIVNGEGMTEEELEQAIVEALIANGASSADVNIEMLGDGISRINISVGEMEGQLPGDSLTIEIINNGGGSTVTSE